MNNRKVSSLKRSFNLFKHTMFTSWGSSLSITVSLTLAGRKRETQTLVCWLGKLVCHILNSKNLNVLAFLGPKLNISIWLVLFSVVIDVSTCRLSVCWWRRWVGKRWSWATERSASPEWKRTLWSRVSVTCWRGSGATGCRLNRSGRETC